MIGWIVPRKVEGDSHKDYGKAYSPRTMQDDGTRTFLSIQLCQRLFRPVSLRICGRTFSSRTLYAASTVRDALTLLCVKLDQGGEPLDSLVLPSLAPVLFAIVPTSTSTLLSSLAAILLPARVATPAAHPRVGSTLCATSTPVLSFFALD